MSHSSYVNLPSPLPRPLPRPLLLPPSATTTAATSAATSASCTAPGSRRRRLANTFVFVADFPIATDGSIDEPGVAAARLERVETVAISMGSPALVGRVERALGAPAGAVRLSADMRASARSVRVSTTTVVGALAAEGFESFETARGAVEARLRKVTAATVQSSLLLAGFTDPGVAEISISSTTDHIAQALQLLATPSRPPQLPPATPPPTAPPFPPQPDAGMFSTGEVGGAGDATLAAFGGALVSALAMLGCSLFARSRGRRRKADAGGISPSVRTSERAPETGSKISRSERPTDTQQNKRRPQGGWLFDWYGGSGGGGDRGGSGGVGGRGDGAGCACDASGSGASPHHPAAQDPCGQGPHGPVVRVTAAASLEGEPPPVVSASASLATHSATPTAADASWDAAFRGDPGDDAGHHSPLGIRCMPRTAGGASASNPEVPTQIAGAGVRIPTRLPVRPWVGDGEVRAWDAAFKGEESPRRRREASALEPRGSQDSARDPAPQDPAPDPAQMLAACQADKTPRCRLARLAQPREVAYHGDEPLTCSPRGDRSCIGGRSCRAGAGRAGAGRAGTARGAATPAAAALQLEVETFLEGQTAAAVSGAGSAAVSGAGAAAVSGAGAAAVEHEVSPTEMCTRNGVAVLSPRTQPIPCGETVGHAASAADHAASAARDAALSGLMRAGKPPLDRKQPAGWPAGAKADRPCDLHDVTWPAAVESDVVRFVSNQLAHLADGESIQALVRQILSEEVKDGRQNSPTCSHPTRHRPTQHCPTQHRLTQTQHRPARHRPTQHRPTRPGPSIESQRRDGDGVAERAIQTGIQRVIQRGIHPHRERPPPRMQRRVVDSMRAPRGNPRHAEHVAGSSRDLGCSRDLTPRVCTRDGETGLMRPCASSRPPRAVEIEECAARTPRNLRKGGVHRPRVATARVPLATAEVADFNLTC